MEPLFADVLPTLLIIAVVVGALAAGWATPNECARPSLRSRHRLWQAICAASNVRRTAYRAVTLDGLFKALKGTAAISGMILFIMLGTTTFAQILSFLGASNGLVQIVTGQGWSTSLVFAGMLLTPIVLGVFVEQVSMMTITLPIFMPIVQRLGVDPPSVTMAYIFQAVIPYVAMSLVLLLAVFWWPFIATWLPTKIG